MSMLITQEKVLLYIATFTYNDISVIIHILSHFSFKTNLMSSIHNTFWLGEVKFISDQIESGQVETLSLSTLTTHVLDCCSSCVRCSIYKDSCMCFAYFFIFF